MSSNISGPVNVVRVEGYINNIKKVLYLFMDIHVFVFHQTKCSGQSININKYFVDSFKKISKNNQQYDFFIENHESTLGKKSPFSKEGMPSYIQQVQILLSNIMYSNTLKSVYKNIRIHHIDIREYYDSILNIFHELDDMIEPDIDIDDCDNISELLANIGKHYPKIKKLFNINLSKSNKNNKQKYILNKLINHYNNDNVRKIMLSLIQRIYYDLYELEILCLELITNVLMHQNLLLQPIDHLRKTTISYNPYAYGATEDELNDSYNKLFHSYTQLQTFHLDTFIRLMDYFFLRRFLDKEYITNGICYTGASHSIDIIYVLVKLFDFKITHVVHSDPNDLSKLNNEIKTKNNFHELTEMLFPKKVLQCSNMKNFPKNFA